MMPLHLVLRLAPTPLHLSKGLLRLRHTKHLDRTDPLLDNSQASSHLQLN